MYVSVGMLIWDIYRTGRVDYCRRTLSSLALGGEPFNLNIVTNGSTDGTNELVERLGGTVFDESYPNAMWFGWEQAMLKAAEDESDIIVFTADDIEYQPGWIQKLRDFWDNAPDDIKVLTLFLEMDWAWNTIRERVEYGGVPALIRDSCPSASWSFRRKDLDLMVPVPQQSPGEDHAVIGRLRDQGYRVAQCNLAEHIGEKNSAWGNKSWEYGKPVDRELWNI